MIEKVIVYRDTLGEWRLSAKAANGEQIVGSSEGYKNYGHAMVVARNVFPGVQIEDAEGHRIPALPGETVATHEQIQRLVRAVGKALDVLQVEGESFLVDDEIEALAQAYEPFRTQLQ